jgi:hypothetical protein
MDQMSLEQENKAVVVRWFDGFWANPWKPEIIDELAAPDMLSDTLCMQRAAGETMCEAL